MKEFNFLVNHKEDVMRYLKSRYPLFHKSNLFFRDLQYGIRHFLESKDIKVSYTESEMLANEFSKILESENILHRIGLPLNDSLSASGNSTWRLNYPEFTASKKANPIQNNI